MTTPATETPGQFQLTQVQDWVNTWNQSTGYQFAGQITDAMIAQMAEGSVQSTGHVVTSLFDVGQYMAGWLGTPGYPTAAAFSTMPWAQYGLTQEQYRSSLLDYSSAYKQLTGQDLTGDALNQAFVQGQSAFTASEYEQSLKNDPNFLNQFAWVKYGLDYQQLQTQKLSWQTQFGHTLSDAEAVTQLQYLHTSQGGSGQARLTPATPGQTSTTTPGPTGTSVVR